MQFSAVYGASARAEREPGLADLGREILQHTDACVACGMCLSSCPTYARARNEAESPRGRIALIQGLMRGNLVATPKLVEHLDHCLNCQACERVCPAQVPYGKIIDGGRAYLRQSGAVSLSRSDAWFPRMMERPRLSLFGRLLYFYRASGLARLLARTGRSGARHAKALAGTAAWRYRWRDYYPPTGKERGQVALFVGCIANVTDRDTLAAAIRVMNKLGYGVHVPKSQGCCGAAAHHSGQRTLALKQAKRNLAAFDVPVDAVVTTASGCGALLSQYGELGWTDESAAERGQALASRVKDISAFLAEVSLGSWPANIELSSSRMRVGLHTPCTLKNAMRQEHGVRKVLSAIPGLEVIDLGGSCCGAAGTHMLRHPGVADSLAEDVLTKAGLGAVDLIVSANVGCAIHLAANGGDKPLEVLHPVTLLDRSMVALSEPCAEKKQSDERYCLQPKA